MTRTTKTLKLKRPGTVDHDALIRRGNKLHEARRYAAALPWYEQALLIAPQCPCAIYCRANSLHMLDRDEEAQPLLRTLIQAKPQELRDGCPEAQPRSIQLDAHFLLFLVLLDCGGSFDDAFAFAVKHLHMRRRGLNSVWSVREVRKIIAEKWRELKALVKNQR